MHSLPPIIEALNSFRNLYTVVLRCIEKDTRSASTLSPVIGLSMNSTRHRIRNPQLWQVNEIEKVAVYYKLSASACVRLRETIPAILAFVAQLQHVQRKQLENICQLKMAQLAKRLPSGGLVSQIEKLYYGLTSCFVRQ